MGKYVSKDNLSYLWLKIKSASAGCDIDEAVTVLAPLLFCGEGWIIKIMAGTTCQGVTNNTSEDKWFRTKAYANMASRGGKNCVGFAYVGGFTTSMAHMFNGCSSLTSLDVSCLDTSNVTNMGDMFNNCKQLTSLDVSNFDTSQVTDMRRLFNNCKQLTSLDVSNFDTSQVTDIFYMFYNCSNLTSLDVSNFDTSKVTSMLYVFCNCSNLTSLDVSNFDTSNVTSMSGMFYGCSSLTSLDVSNFDTSQVTSMAHMFNGCSSLTSLDVSGWDTSQVTNMSGMFYDCQSLRYITLGAGFFKTTKNIPFGGATNLGLDEEYSANNGWIAHLAETAPTITDGISRTIQLTTALLVRPWAQDYITTLQTKGYTIAS